MSPEIMHQIVEAIEAEVRSRPSPPEFEMAYQVRVAMDRIKFAIKHAEQFSKPCIQMRDASLQLLDALERLESLDRRFQVRCRVEPFSRNGSETSATAQGTGTGLAMSSEARNGVNGEPGSR